MAARKKGNSGRLHLRLPQPLVDEVHDYASAHHTSVNAVVEKLLREFLEVQRAMAYEAEQV